MLKEHNQEAYEAVKKMLKAHKECCIVAATGIGKSNIITELLRDLNLNAMIIVPNKSLEDEWNKIYEKYDTEYFSIITYHYFNLHYKDLYGFDAYIFDEAHHMGAKEWGKAIKEFKSEMIDELFIGATADDTRYFDDDIKTVANTFFNGDHIVYGLNQQEAIERGILPRAKYVCAIYNVEEIFAKYKTIELSDELKGKLNYTIQNCKSIKNILQENIPNNNPVKGIVFVDTIKNIGTGVELVKKAFPNEPVYFIHSKLGNKNNERILNEFRATKSGFIVNVNMLNEGNHIEGINTIIMLRKTSSPSLYTQQIGRGLSANCDNITIFDLVRNDTSIKSILSRLDSISEVCNTNKKEKQDSTINKNLKISNQFIVKNYATDILEILEMINRKDKNWSSEEDDIIRKYYPVIGINVYKKLPGRTPRTCIDRAKHLKIKSESRYWTIEEDNILREYYPSMGYNVYEKLPGRSKKGCIKRANKLGLQKMYKWTIEEDNILREYYPSMGSNVYEKLNGRSKQSCRSRANRLGLSYTNKKPLWTIEEDNILREYYPSMGSNVYEKLPGRSSSACMTRISYLKLISKS